MLSVLGETFGSMSSITWQNGSLACRDTKDNSGPECSCFPVVATQSRLNGKPHVCSGVCLFPIKHAGFSPKHKLHEPALFLYG